ncbi:MAG: Trehalose/maltose transport system permease protein MalG [Candidatus Bathyarchaeota archaeon BA1]|nr:MAG: Trehalose/maltose transport system permease protein MalG [Candidatus Bathyarchaeota archaeon BA1]
MRSLKRASPYLVLGLVSLPPLIMYLAFFVQSFSERISLGIIPIGVGISNFNFLWRPIPWGLEKTTIWEVLRNTILYAGASGGTVTIICLLGGYALSRMSFKGKGFFLSLQLLLHAFPGHILLIAVFFLLLYLKLLYTIPGVATARASIEIPLGIMMAKGFFDAVPWDLERAAMVDGCGRFGVWLKIFLPLIKPGIAAVFIWGFIFAWHEFIFVFTLLPGAVRLMSTLIQAMIATEVLPTGLLAAVSLFYMLPPLMFFIILQKALLKVPVLGGKGM